VFLYMKSILQEEASISECSTTSNSEHADWDHISENEFLKYSSYIPECKKYNAGTGLQVLQDSYMIKFRKHGNEVSYSSEVEIKLFMVNESLAEERASSDSNSTSSLNSTASYVDTSMKIVHILLRPELWVEIVISEESYKDKKIQRNDNSQFTIDPLDIYEPMYKVAHSDSSQYVFQLFRCDECGDFQKCHCEDKCPQTIWLREEDIRLDESALKKNVNGMDNWNDHFSATQAYRGIRVPRRQQEYNTEKMGIPESHKCSADCELSVPPLNLFLVSNKLLPVANFELSISQSKKVRDLADNIYTVS